jgi:hypothetical protein
MGLVLGMQCVQSDALAREPARIARLAALVTDSRWFYRFKMITTQWEPGQPPAPRFKGVIPAAKLRGAALEALSSPSVASAMFGVSAKEALDHAHFNASLGRSPSESDAIQSNARIRMPPDVVPDEVATRWVELQHAIVETVGAIHGVIVTATNEDLLRAEIWLSLTVRDGRVMHPRPEEIQAYAYKRWLLGHEYVRRPRWGTYLKPAHVEAVGGRAKILEVVQPEVTRDVGDLFYVQLTAKVTQAASETAKRRYEAFAELLAPITMPPAPAD